MDAALKASLPQVGAPDPELENSPIVDESEFDEHAGAGDLEREAPVCYFNGEAYSPGTFVLSGHELLECTARGVWLSKGEQA